MTRTKEEDPPWGCLFVLGVVLLCIFTGWLGNKLFPYEPPPPPPGVVTDNDVREPYCDEDWGCYSRSWMIYVEYDKGGDSWESVTKSQYDACSPGSRYPECL